MSACSPGECLDYSKGGRGHRGSFPPRDFFFADSDGALSIVYEYFQPLCWTHQLIRVGSVRGGGGGGGKIARGGACDMCHECSVPFLYRIMESMQKRAC